MNKRVRIKDIALKAGVSKGTVDRVIHNRGNVSPPARERVLQAMSELDYQPNVIASALAYNREFRIATLLPRPQEDPFWQQPIAGIERALKAVRDYGISIDFYVFKDADIKDFKRQFRKVLKSNYNALLIAPVFLKEANKFLDICEEQELPFVLINTFLDRADKNFICYIGQDSYHSGILGAKLLDFGLARGETAAICHLEKGVYNSQHLIEKEKGFRDYFKKIEKGKHKIVTLKFEDPTKKDALKQYLVEQLQLHPKLKAIFVTTSKAYYVAEQLKQLGREDVKLVGFDLVEENLKYLHDGNINFLINQNPLKQGYLAIINIFNRFILKKNVAQLQHLPLDIVMPENAHYYLEKEEQLHLIF